MTLNRAIPLNINNETDLELRIMQLRAQKLKEESLLKEDFRAIAHSMRPASLVKQFLVSLQEDKGVRGDLFKASLNIGSSFILDKIFRRRSSGLKSYFVNALLKKAVSFVIKKQQPSHFKKEQS